MATNVLPPLSVSGNSIGSGEGRARQLSPKVPSHHPRARQILSDTEPVSLRSSGRPTHRAAANVKEKQQKRALFKDINPASYRHTILHNICTEMLEKGFHKSFSELFNLVQQQKAEHEQAGPAAVLLEPLIYNNHAKLEYLRVQLTRAEGAERTGDLETVYSALRSIAEHFEHNQGTWLAFHFYQRSLETASRITGDNQRTEGEGLCSMGLAMESRGDIQKAAGHFELFQKLARKHKWSTDSGDSVYEISCEHLRRVYTRMAEKLKADNLQEAIVFLKKAHEMAKESRDSNQEGLACYRLGNAHEALRDNDTAIQYHKKYLERCKYHRDNVGSGNAYEALAKCYENKGDVESAVKHLELYVEVAGRADDHQAMARACSAIGVMYNTLGEYEKAVHYFGQCYELCTQLNDHAALHAARVQYGIAKGHQLFQGYSGDIADSGSGVDNLQQLLAWKDNRAIASDESEGVEEEEVASRDEGVVEEHCDDDTGPLENTESDESAS